MSNINEKKAHFNIKKNQNGFLVLVKGALIIPSQPTIKKPTDKKEKKNI